MTNRVAVIIGIGPGLGSALVRRFHREGYQIAGIARNAQDMIEIEDTGVMKINADATRTEEVAQAMADIREAFGPPEVMIYNAGRFKMAGILEVSPAQFESHWRVNCLGAFLAMRETIPDMVAAGHGSILLTSATAAWRGSARFSCLSVGKFGLRSLAQSAAREFGPQGIHIASVVIDGLIDTARVREAFGDTAPKLNPEAIAETYWQLHSQDPSAWTLELDLRPSTETF